jgi:hypothetical protein
VASGSRSSVYLSGWEYNRVLQADPAQPRNSALPASILWNGSHQLWMFETVFCTQESFENEVAATEVLGWVNGTVLRDLADEGILRTVDWQRLPIETKDRLLRVRQEILKDLSEDQIRHAISVGDTPTLELAKTAMLEPVLDLYRCFESGAPNSVSTWIRPVSVTGSPKGTGLGRDGGLSSVLIPGLQACRPPGSGVSERSRLRERHIQETVEKPMIPQLLAGEGDFQGARGFEPYLQRLAQVKDAYAETNAQLSGDWKTNKGQLFRLRDAASRHLWPDLHGYWLPRLANESDPRAGKEFERWVRSAARLAPIVRYLESGPTRIIVGKFGPPALAVALAHAGIPWPDAVASGGAAALGASAVKRHFDQVAHLALFFQEARGLSTVH